MHSHACTCMGFRINFYLDALDAELCKTQYFKIVIVYKMMRMCVKKELFKGCGWLGSHQTGIKVGYPRKPYFSCLYTISFQTYNPCIIGSMLLKPFCLTFVRNDHIYKYIYIYM